MNWVNIENMMETVSGSEYNLDADEFHLPLQ